MNPNLSTARARQQLISAWTLVEKSTGIGAIHSEADYEAMRKLADQLVDQIGAEEAHPLSGLLDVVLELMESWEDENVSFRKQSPREVLAYLMEANGLKQTDLAESVSQGTLSNILRGKREISKGMAKKFAGRFGVNAAVFL
jgi:HTH-type transcriptional regulator/antitoxin HigA